MVSGPWSRASGAWPPWVLMVIIGISLIGIIIYIVPHSSPTCLLVMMFVHAQKPWLRHIGCDKLLDMADKWYICKEGLLTGSGTSPKEKYLLQTVRLKAQNHLSPLNLNPQVPDIRDLMVFALSFSLVLVMTDTEVSAAFTHWISTKKWDETFLGPSEFYSHSSNCMINS